MLRLVLSLRFIVLAASIGALLGAFAMFWQAGLKLAHTFSAMMGGAEAAKSIVPAVMSATDAFLFGILLIIFSYAITFTFVFNLSAADREKLPAWARIDSIAALEHTMVEMILVYVIVDFVTDIGEAGVPLTWETLVKPISVLLIAAAHRLISSHLPKPGGH
ncbi:MAG TPA: YqhA family protein [Xanthobacteraceae bacterium]|nr:YqhA family protein [Xanthobacteraceae bacterium]